MKITALALTAPPAAENDPKITPELLAASLAKYSRSNLGIDAIVKAIDWTNPDKAVEAIFKFVDYGHASIGGLTGSIPMAIDGVSMLLAYKLFEFAQQGDGQESSTRYIEMQAESLPFASEVGIPEHLQDLWQETMLLALAVYRDLYQDLDTRAKENPEIVRLPANAGPKVVDRLRKNYALDRARYVLPLAIKTNIALVMSARAWAELIRQTEALQLPEAIELATQLRAQLEKYVPRLIRHSHADAPSTNQAQQALRRAEAEVLTGVPITGAADKVQVTTESSFADYLPDNQSAADAFEGKINRYSVVGPHIRRVMVRMAWNNMTIAELRDLNRHRTGYRYTPLVPVGFYMPAGVEHPKLQLLLAKYSELLKGLAASGTGTYLYGLLLGTQTPFEHSTHLDKVLYEIELRTGMGAHYRYAEHLKAVAEQLLTLHPELAPHLLIGTAEPE